MAQNAALVFITGQSNAHAHSRALPVQDRITEPLRNVFALDRAQNQSLDVERLVWTGFTTCGKNLGETQDHTASLSYYLALRWQHAIDAGTALPDLYIVQISIGSQGIINGMWNPDWPRSMKPGPLDSVNISLFPLAKRVFSLAWESIEQQGLTPLLAGWHWIGSEQDVQHGAYLREDLPARYDSFFDTLLSCIAHPCPVYLYKIYMKEWCKRHDIPAEAVDRINEQLLRQCAKQKDFHMVAAENSPLWDASLPNLGIYAPDNGHYLAPVHQWFADRFFDEWTSRYPAAR